MNLLKNLKNKLFKLNIPVLGITLTLAYPMLNSLFINNSKLLYSLLLFTEIFLLVLFFLINFLKNIRKVITVSVILITCLVLDVLLRGNSDILSILKELIQYAYLPLIFIICFNSADELLTLLYKISPYLIYILTVSVIINIDQYLNITGNWLGYQVLLPYAFLEYHTLQDYKYAKKHIPALLFGIILLFLGGTRTPLLLCIIQFLIVVGHKFYIKSLRLFGGYIVCLSSMISLFFPIMKVLDNYLLGKGIIIRIIHIFGDMNILSLFNLSNRVDDFYAVSISFIKINPLFGYGLAQDRINICSTLLNKSCTLVEASGYYSHNIVLEMLQEFGIILGAILLAVLIISVICLIKWKKVMLPFFICCFIPLLLSNSWLGYLPFWLYIGYFILVVNSKRRIYFVKNYKDKTSTAME